MVVVVVVVVMMGSVPVSRGWGLSLGLSPSQNSDGWLARVMGNPNQLFWEEERQGTGRDVSWELRDVSCDSTYQIPSSLLFSLA
jgi:hypothetical protein